MSRKDEDLNWIAKRVDEWPDGTSEVARLPIDWEARFNNSIIPSDANRFDFIQYSMERKRQGLPVPDAPKSKRDIDVEEVLRLFRGDYCEERARQVIELLIEENMLDVDGIVI